MHLVIKSPGAASDHVRFRSVLELVTHAVEAATGDARIALELDRRSDQLTRMINVLLPLFVPPLLSDHVRE